MFEDKILLKIKREYSKDESFALVLKKLSEAQIENGILKSELSELREEINKMRNSHKQEGMRTRKVWLKDDLFAELRTTLEALQQKEKALQKEVNEWRDNYFALLRKTQIHYEKK